MWRCGSKPTPGPNTYGFASQWNIGLMVPITTIRGYEMPILFLFESPSMEGESINTHLLNMNRSQMFKEPSKVISYLVGDYCRHFADPLALCLYNKKKTDSLNRWYRLYFVTCRVHFTNRLPMFPSIFLQSY